MSDRHHALTIMARLIDLVGDEWLGPNGDMTEDGILDKAVFALDALAELIEKADAALMTLGRYAVKIDGEWGDCLELEELLANGEESEYANLRDALNRVRGEK